MTDEWAAEASEFETVDELTADVTERLRQRHVVQAQMALQQKTAEALVELVTEEIPEVLVAGGAPRAHPRPQPPPGGPGLSLGQFLGATGRDEQEFLDELRVGALQSVKADLALRALVEAEEIEVTDEELGRGAGRHGRAPRDGRRRGARASSNGPAGSRRYARTGAKRKAMRWLLDNVELVDEEGNPVSRDDLLVNQGEEDSE